MSRMESRTDIVLVGPVYPYKSGIAHYTGLLCGELRRHYRVTMISYSMQYPKLLFRKEQRDYENDTFKAEDTEYLINTASPPSILRAADRINSLSPSLVIIQWWHPYFAPCYSILTGRLKSRVLFTCHNVFPHERFPFDRLLTKHTLKKGDYFILHSQKDAGDLLSIIGDAKYAVTVHPTYSAFRKEARKDLDSPAGQETEGDAPGLLFFGFVRPYKGLRVLIEALTQLPEAVRLGIVGDFGGKREEYEALIREKDLTGRIHIHDGYVPDSEVGAYFERCDAVVLPYLEATQSGIAQIAFGFEKPVIATRAGGLPEVVKDGETGVLCEPGDPEALSAAIRRFYELRDTVDFAGNIREDAKRFSWEAMAEAISGLTGLPYTR